MKSGQDPAVRRVVLFAVLLTACPAHPVEDGKKLEAEGRFAEAGETYLTAAKDDPANLAAWDAAIDLWCKKQINVGECMTVLDVELQLLGNLERHTEALAEVLEMRARARLENDLVDAAIEDLDRAIKAAPNRASTYVALARCQIRRGQNALALEALTKAKRIDPKQSEADELLKTLPSGPGEETFGGE
jgi:tetratricopeptide (TPR) repeat protein